MSIELWSVFVRTGDAWKSRGWNFLAPYIVIARFDNQIEKYLS